MARCRCCLSLAEATPSGLGASWRQSQPTLREDEPGSSGALWHCTSSCLSADTYWGATAWWSFRLCCGSELCRAGQAGSPLPRDDRLNADASLMTAVLCHGAGEELPDGQPRHQDGAQRELDHRAARRGAGVSRRSVFAFRLVGSVLSRISCKDVPTHARLAPSAHRSQALPCQRQTPANWGLCSTVVLI